MCCWETHLNKTKVYGNFSASYHSDQVNVRVFSQDGNVQNIKSDYVSQKIWVILSSFILAIVGTC